MGLTLSEAALVAISTRSATSATAVTRIATPAAVAATAAVVTVVMTAANERTRESAGMVARKSTRTLGASVAREFRRAQEKQRHGIAKILLSWPPGIEENRRAMAWLCPSTNT